jgi:hypothetical protein
MGDIHVERRKKVDPRFSSGIRQVLPACFRLALRQLNLVCNGAALPPRVSMLSCHQGMKVAPAIFGDTQPLEQAELFAMPPHRGPMLRRHLLHYPLVN